MPRTVGDEVATASGRGAQLSPKAAAAIAAAEYEERFGPRVGLGPWAGFLGDPSRFDFQWAHGCNYYLGGFDESGNQYLILIADTDRKPLYDWRGLNNRVGYQAARNLFAELEEQTLRESGGIGRGDNSGLALAGPNYYNPPADPDEVQLRRRAIGGIHSYDSSDIVYRSDVGVVDLSHGGEATRLRAADPTTDILINRALIRLDLWGRPCFAIVNPILRVGYLYGFRVEVQTGDTFALSLAKTVGDVALIVVGVFAAQPGLIGRSLDDIGQTWINYAADLDRLAHDADIRGLTLDQLAGRNILCGTVAPRKDFFTKLNEVLHGR